MSTIEVDGQRVPIDPKPRFDQNDNWSKSQVLRTDEAKRAAAIATGEMVQDMVEHTNSRVTAENGARILEELTEGLGVAGPAQVVLPASVTVEPELEVAEVPSLDYELPDSIAEMLGEPDDPVIEDELEDDDEPEPTPAPTDDDEYVDPEVAKLRKKVEAAERRAEHERQLRVQSSRKGWEDEARRVFQINGTPLLSDDELAAIDADSHKGFLREAKAIADRNKQIAQRFVTQPVPERRDPVQDPEVWGTPTVGDQTASVESVDQQRRLQSARRTGRLSEVLKAHMYPNG
jgi:hypothetical protein